MTEPSKMPTAQEVNREFNQAFQALVAQFEARGYQFYIQAAITKEARDVIAAAVPWINVDQIPIQVTFGLMPVAAPQSEPSILVPPMPSENSTPQSEVIKPPSPNGHKKKIAQEG